MKISSLQKGLVGHWPLAQQDLQSTTTIADKTPYGNTGTLVGSPTFTTDQHGQANRAMAFDGSSQDILNSTANFRSGDSAGSISAWINFSSIAAAICIFGSSDQGTSTSYIYALVRSATSRLSIAQRNAASTLNNIEGTTVLSINTWYHIGVTSSGTAWALYVNGVAESLTVLSGANTGDWFADTTLRDNFTIGALKHSSVVNYFPGSIAAVRLYDRALSATEVTSLYNLYL